MTIYQAKVNAIGKRKRVKKSKVYPKGWRTKAERRSGPRPKA